MLLQANLTGLDTRTCVGRGGGDRSKPNRSIVGPAPPSQICTRARPKMSWGGLQRSFTSTAMAAWAHTHHARPPSSDGASSSSSVSSARARFLGSSSASLCVDDGRISQKAAARSKSKESKSRHRGERAISIENCLSTKADSFVVRCFERGRGMYVAFNCTHQPQEHVDVRSRSTPKPLDPSKSK